MILPSGMALQARVQLGKKMPDGEEGLTLFTIKA
jgi:hypothetical protein